MKCRTDYVEEDLDYVLRYFSKDYSSPKGGTLQNTDHFVDISKRRVIFKMTVIEDE